MKCEDKGTIGQLKRLMSQYDRIFLVFDKNLYELLVEKKDSESKILFLFPDDSFPEHERHLCEDGKKFQELYFMYEFSDRFQVLSRSEYFGSMLNLVDVGILTYEELVEALL